MTRAEEIKRAERYLRAMERDRLTEPADLIEALTQHEGR